MNSNIAPLNNKKTEKGRKKASIDIKYYDKAEKGLRMYMQENGFCFSDAGRKLTGSKKLTGNTMHSYQKHYDGLKMFATKLGDYESLMVMHERAPLEFCPSMEAETVALYMRYKTWSSGTALLSTNDQEAVDSFGEPIECTGHWKDPGNCDQLMSAVTRIHEARGQDGLYLPQCSSCSEEYALNPSSSGCRFHPGQYRVWRKGNPRHSETVQNVYSECKQLCSEHIVKRSYQLLPDEMMEMRALLLATNKIEDLQLWCMMLVSIFLFLRHDEFHQIRVKDIRREFSAVTADKVSTLCFKIKGKTDKIARNLILWAHDDFPMLCPVKHLLAYVHLAELDDDGFLFPDLNNRSRPWSYGSILEVMKKKFKSLLPRNSNLTTHTFQKTGYLFAHWGGGDFETIRTSARHKSDKMAQRYMDDASFLLQNKEVYDENARLKVPKFRMSIMLNEESGARINERKYFRSLYQISQDNLLRCGIDKCHKGRHNLRFVLGEIINFKSDSSIEEDLDKALEGISVEKIQKVKAFFVQVQQRAEHRLKSQRSQAPSCSPESTVQDSPESTVEDPAQEIQTKHLPQKRKRGGSNNLDIRQDLKKFKGKEKLQLLLQINSQVPDPLSELTEGARAFCNTTLFPIMTCFENHFHGNTDAFMNKWKLDKGISRFKKTCCRGEGSECTN